MILFLIKNNRQIIGLRFSKKMKKNLSIKQGKGVKKITIN